MGDYIVVVVGKAGVYGIRCYSLVVATAIQEQIAGMIGYQAFVFTDPVVP